MLSILQRLGYVPRSVVWELTLACDLACRHCGSRAGGARPDELSTEEAKDLVRQMADLGVREAARAEPPAELVLPDAIAPWPRTERQESPELPGGHESGSSERRRSASIPRELSDVAFFQSAG